MSPALTCSSDFLPPPSTNTPSSIAASLGITDLVPRLGVDEKKKPVRLRIRKGFAELFIDKISGLFRRDG